MATVKFSINLREDAWNWVRLGRQKTMLYGRDLKNFTSEIPEPLRRKIRRFPETKALVLVYQHLQQGRENILTDLRAMKVFLGQYMRQYGSGLLAEVARLTGRRLYRQTFYATFTTLYTCPYDPSRHWFMISAKRNMAKQVNTIAHEILHLQFIHYYYHYCLDQGLTEKQFQDLKEAMTVLLNEPQFRKYHLALDLGYPAHVKLRATIARLWHRHLPYAEFLDACIAATKRTLPAR